MWKLRLALLSILCLVVAAAANIPRQSHELAVSLSDGGKVMLTQYRGKVVAVCFILTACPHCQKTVGFLNKAQKDYGPRGFQVLASAIEQDSASHVAGFIKQFNTSFPVGYNDPMVAMEWMQHPAIIGPRMPMLAFVDRQGNVRAQFEGDDEKFFNDQQEQNLRTHIEALLKEGGPVKKSAATAVSKKSLPD